ncbi:hypothetical protein EDC30_109122 [Paucimonas lemoignei]|uniref:Uncharacterized protein n=1 Tax=Paucimonas lemoignei TaxID=29443 RepID=A0A4R3HTM3_PAULE|nr:hypothetical protein [Paucimonas lemoignei]TCS35823.1 hypothetical protein EDC30_109122 [Paucimonas lemoignei]
MTRAIQEISDAVLAEHIRLAVEYAVKAEPRPNLCAVAMLANLSGRLEFEAPQAAKALRAALLGS